MHSVCHVAGGKKLRIPLKSLYFSSAYTHLYPGHFWNRELNMSITNLNQLLWILPFGCVVLSSIYSGNLTELRSIFDFFLWTLINSWVLYVSSLKYIMNDFPFLYPNFQYFCVPTFRFRTKQKMFAYWCLAKSFLVRSNISQILHTKLCMTW